MNLTPTTVCNNDNSFSGYWSTNGIDYYQVGSTQTVAMSEAALEFVRASGIEGSVFNTFSHGDQLIHAFYPRIRVAIDSLSRLANSGPGCTLARFSSQESRGITQRNRSAGTPLRISHRQQSMPVLPPPTIV